jgi:hypothetical protein
VTPDEREIAINELLAYAVTCKRRNTPEWMATFATLLNRAIEARGSDDRVRWPGSWADEFQMEI